MAGMVTALGDVDIVDGACGPVVCTTVAWKPVPVHVPRISFGCALQCQALDSGHPWLSDQNLTSYEIERRGHERV